MRRIKIPKKIWSPWLSRDGQTLILVVLAMTVLMGMAAAGVTVSTVYFSQTRLQNAADAAALAGAGDAAQQNFSAVPGESQLISQDAPGGTGNLTLNQTNETVTAYASAIVPPSFAGVFGFKGFPVKVRAVASYNGGGAFDYAVFQGQTTPGDLAISGDPTIVGSVHSNDGLSVQKARQVSGGCTAGAGDTVSGVCGEGSGTDGYIPMPQWSPSQIPQPLPLPTTSIGPGTDLPPGNYYVKDENVTISGNVTLSGSITVYGGTITIKGTSSINNGATGGLALASFGTASDSGIKYKGTDTINGFLYAPDGSITMDGGGHGHIYGAVVANTINSITGHIHITYDPTEISSIPEHQVVLLQ